MFKVKVLRGAVANKPNSNLQVSYREYGREEVIAKSWLDEIDRYIRENRQGIKAVIDVILQACHTYNVETRRIKDFVTNEKKIPYMSIETDYSETDKGQLQARIAAFLEML